MTTDELIQEVLRVADEVKEREGWRFGDMVVLPLKKYGRVWWDGAGYRFALEHAEVQLYTKNGKSGMSFGPGQFEVHRPSPEGELE